MTLNNSIWLKDYEYVIQGFHNCVMQKYYNHNPKIARNNSIWLKDYEYVLHGFHNCNAKVLQS